MTDLQKKWHQLAEQYHKEEVLSQCNISVSALEAFSAEEQLFFKKIIASQTVTICKKQSLFPVGFVIIGQTSNFSCSHDLNNAWIIKKVGADEITVCKASPIPDGYVIIAQTTNFNCSHELDNAWIIKKVDADEMTVCKASPIPKGYVIIAQMTNFGCSHDLNNAWKIKRV